MGLFDKFFGSQSTQSNLALQAIFPLSMQEGDFIRRDVTATFKKILTDVIERSHDIPDHLATALYDNFLQTDADKGLVSLLSEAMYGQSDLYITYQQGVLRRATREESEQIKADYEQRRHSDKGIYLSFKNYDLSHLLKLYAGFEYCLLSALNKSLNVAKALQFKVDSLRGSVALADADAAIDQGRAIVEALGEGNDVLIDALDSLETAHVQTEPIERAMDFLNNKRAYHLGLPMAYIAGELTTGISTTGEGDTNAIERGLRPYFTSIIKPIFLELFNIDLSFKTTNFRNIETAIELLRTFELVGSEILSTESKREIIARFFDLDLKAEVQRIDSEQSERSKMLEHDGDIDSSEY